MNSGLDFLQRPSSNRPPSDDEVPRIRSFRQDCQARIDSVSQQIEKLLQQRKVLEADLERYDSLLAPVKRVPDDVLSTIFQHASGTGTYVEDFRPFYWQESPPIVAPSQICQDWRRLALLTPSLWSTIPIAAPDHPVVWKEDSDPPHVVERAARRWEARIKQLLEIFALWIERSKQDPLSIVLRFNAVGGGGKEGTPQKAFPLYLGLVSLVCRVAPRWKKLDLSIDTNYPPILNTLMALKPDDVPQLEVISCGDCAGVAEPVLAQLGVFMAERLRSFTMIQLRDGWSKLSINWAVVKELQLGVESRCLRAGEPLYSRIEKSFGTHAIRSLLHMCPDLERWELSVETSNGIYASGDATLPVSVRHDHRENVRHPHLKSLIFHGSHPSEALTSSLDLPSLQQLHFLGGPAAYKGAAEGRETLSRRFLWSVDRYGAQLTDLRFTHLLLSDMASIARCFGSLPNLLSLHLDGGVPTFNESTNDVVTNLSNAAVAILVALTPDVREDQHPAAEAPLCPKLTRFAYQPTLQCFTENQLLEFVVGRSRISGALNIARIEEVEVRFAIPQEMDIASVLKSRGVDVDHLTLRIQYPRRLEGQTIVMVRD